MMNFYINVWKLIVYIKYNIMSYILKAINSKGCNILIAYKSTVNAKEWPKIESQFEINVNFLPITILSVK